MPQIHPCPDDAGKPVILKAPSTPTPPGCWEDPDAIARAVPGGPLPESLNGLALATWEMGETRNLPFPWEAGGATLGREAPQDSEAHPLHLDAPKLRVSPGKAAAAGAVVIEPDSRVWVIHPSNAFGGYRATFPKGKQDAGLSLEQTAIKETFEEAGLIVALTRWLVDVPRSTSVCRYFLARRLGGTPAAMGWESQAVSLVPRERLPEVLHHSNDQPILEAMRHA